MKKELSIIIVTVALVFGVRAAFALEEELTHIAEGQYFSVYGPADLDVRALLTKLNYQYFLQVDSLLEERDDASDSLLSKTLDSLYLEASDVLGIHVYSFHGNLAIYPDKEALNLFFKNYSDQVLHESSYYLHEKKTIYISYPEITLGMIGHEIAHAIISNYFIVLPPPQVQEILSGYVDYSLQKKTR